MLFGKSKIRRIFAKHYKIMSKITKKAVYANNPEFELLPAMYAICNYAAASSGVDFENFDSDLLEECKLLVKNFNFYDFLSRMKLYIDIEQSEYIRCEWNPAGNTNLKDIPMMVYYLILGDILYNPECIYDYHNAPYAIYGLNYCLEFKEQVMTPLFKKTVAFTVAILRFFELKKVFNN